MLPSCRPIGKQVSRLSGGVWFFEATYYYRHSVRYDFHQQIDLINIAEYPPTRPQLDPRSGRKRHFFFESLPAREPTPVGVSRHSRFRLVYALCPGNRRQIIY